MVLASSVRQFKERPPLLLGQPIPLNGGGTRVKIAIYTNREPIYDI